jgi:hypothetical protein
MTADLQDLFDRAGRNPPTGAFDADTVLRRARRSRNRRITGVVAVAVVVTLALVAGLASQRLLSADPIPAAPHPTTAPHPIAQVPGSLGRLAYGMDGDIYVADADGSNPVRIANGVSGGVDGCPSYWGEGPLWSPDGRYPAYRGKTGGDTGSNECQFDRTVNISDPAGHRFASFPGEGWAIAWSPDSTRVAAWIDFYGDPTLGIYGLDGERQALLTVPPGLTALGDVDPVWSPDGTSLLLPLGGVVPVDGSTPRKLPADDPRSLWNATYSPDGADVAYITEDGLAVAAGDGSRARLLVPGCVEGYQAGPPSLAWSPTGDRIAFAFESCDPPRDEGYATELCVVDVASGTVVSLADINGPDDVLISLKFSPKGDQILFARTTPNYNAGGSSLWSVHADGSDLHRLVAGTRWGDWQKVIPAR